MTLPIKDIKKHYLILFETGLIFSLLILLSAFNINTGTETTYTVSSSDVDVVQALDIPVTDQRKQPKYLEPTVKAQKPVDKVIDPVIDDLEEFKNSDTNQEKLTLPASNKEDEEKIFRIVEREPAIVGGKENLYQKITYPQRAKAAGIEGIVIVQFVVNKDGSVTDAKVTRGIGGGCDEEALEAVKKLIFIPGRQRERVVRVQMNISVKFELKN